MKAEVYKQTKLNIFESFQSGDIDAGTKDQLLTMLESKAEEDEKADKEVKDAFDLLKKTYPDLEKDIEKLEKKACEDDSDDDEDDEKEEEKEDEDGGEEEAENEGEEKVEESANSDMYNFFKAILSE